MSPLNHTSQSSDGTLWDARDVARYLKVSRSWVYQRTEAGLLPHLRIGGLLRFDPAAIRAFAMGDAAPHRADVKAFAPPKSTPQQR